MCDHPIPILVTRLARRLMRQHPQPTNGDICYALAMQTQPHEHSQQRPEQRPGLNLGNKTHGVNYMAPLPTALRKKLARAIQIYYPSYFYQPAGSEGLEYHKWYYNTDVWKTTTWMGVACQKSPSDLWNYQEILFDLKPSLVIEFGTNYGGSALYFANVMRQIGQPFKVLSVDISHYNLEPAARADSDILFVESSSTVPAIAERIQSLKSEYPGKIFAILDSAHTMDHVLNEMKLLRPILSAGDYLLVEDSMLNGHPVVPLWGPGPYEAIEAYEQEFPNDYTHDLARENKFGWTQAPYGYLIRN
ncbi:MAG TPA: CmcI family methyltransferase [Pirellulales bacterium]|nr:CmcI family methyltransferase [Pirellulales bacterium]